MRKGILTILESEAFQKDIKSAIEYGKGEAWGIVGDDYEYYETFDLDEAFPEVMKVIKEYFLDSPSNDAVDWLNKEKAKRQQEIAEWRMTALRRNICDNQGRNPIDKLNSEIRMIEEIRIIISKNISEKK